MPERRDSADSFDDFFGVPRTTTNGRKSPVEPKKAESSISALIKRQPTIDRPKTPPQPDKRAISSPKTKPKVNPIDTPLASIGQKPTNNTGASYTTTTKKNIHDADTSARATRKIVTPLTVDERPSVNNSEVSLRGGHVQKNTNRTPTSLPMMPSRAASAQSKVYESDFDDDDDHNYEDDDTPKKRTEHSSVPPSKQRIGDARRRGSDSELKSSSHVPPRHHLSTKDHTRRKDPLLPTIRPQQPRRPVVYPVRRRRASPTLSSKTDQEQRALSARTNKLKGLESRLAELRRELDAQRTENATLRTIQFREEKAIKKYQEKEYDIHRIVRDYTHEIDHVKENLLREREVKQRLERQLEVRDEKLRDQTQRLKHYEQIVHEKNLDERHELREKLNETNKKLDEYQEKLNAQLRYVENLEKNHRYEINQELSKQRDLKRELEKRSQKYTDLMSKFDDKTRQIDAMHIHVQRAGKRSADDSTNLSKSRSLQSLQEASPRAREKKPDSDRKRREQEKPSSKSKPASNDDSSLNYGKKNDHPPAKAKPAGRRLSTPKSVDDEIDNESIVDPPAKKAPASVAIQRDEQYLSQSQIQKRPPPVSEVKSNPSGPSVFKLTEPPSNAAAHARAKRDLDAKWSDMFGSSKKEDAKKEDLLARLIADEQKERRLAAAANQSMHTTTTARVSDSTVALPPRAPPKPSADPFESLFNSPASKPIVSRPTNTDDIFSTKPSTQTRAATVDDPFESLFGSSTATANTNARQSSSQNDKLQRPKVVNNATKSIPNRLVIDEVEDFPL